MITKRYPHLSFWLFVASALAIVGAPLVPSPINLFIVVVSIMSLVASLTMLIVQRKRFLQDRQKSS
jgi:hypothetical protein